ncbi:MarR family winged helix-turn-helix transcriptional regulator [Mycolicibacterium sp. P1-5]|uniref:MarR family winged helix-turn-helix transcriptional regulator n=1 Tax=Mycolicibacterium sp. P1-5 TaxID=2024617 RepID=UPI0011EC9951|nr:MarR family transcriptional regulator [Mycolicibacterium sp. P1-5]KAA0111407.1 MarR family transcriptional regulator [Mycolicibacterium sp. P1-5]
MDSDGRPALESAVVADVQALSAESDQIGRAFAGIHQLSATDFRALVHIMVAENAGTPLTAGELRTRMGLSGAAITYLVERMIESGHLQRDSDPADRRKVILRYADHGIEVGRAFFTPLAAHTHRALAELTDRDLAAAHRVFTAVLEAMTAFRADLRS